MKNYRWDGWALTDSPRLTAVSQKPWFRQQVEHLLLAKNQIANAVPELMKADDLGSQSVESAFAVISP
jgi:hypothetical protein